MVSEIKVDTIVNAGGDNDTGIDLATNDQILLKVANATKLTMNSTGQTTIVGEGGTTTTSVQQGLAKVWANNSTSAIVDSFNTSGFTDNGTGDFTTAFTNNMNNTTFSPKGCCVVAELFSVESLSASSSVTVNVFQRSDSFVSTDQVHFLDIHGDLA